MKNNWRGRLQPSRRRFRVTVRAKKIGDQQSLAVAKQREQASTVCQDCRPERLSGPHYRDFPSFTPIFLEVDLKSRALLRYATRRPVGEGMIDPQHPNGAEGRDNHKYHLAPTFSPSQIAKPPRFNAYYPIEDVKPVDGATWTLELAGRIEDKRSWTAFAEAAENQS